MPSHHTAPKRRGTQQRRARERALAGLQQVDRDMLMNHIHVRYGDSPSGQYYELSMENGQSSSQSTTGGQGRKLSRGESQWTCRSWPLAALLNLRKALSL